MTPRSRNVKQHDTAFVSFSSFFPDNNNKKNNKSSSSNRKVPLESATKSSARLSRGSRASIFAVAAATVVLLQAATIYTVTAAPLSSHGIALSSLQSSFNYDEQQLTPSSSSSHVDSIDNGSDKYSSKQQQPQIQGATTAVASNEDYHPETQRQSHRRLGAMQQRSLQQLSEEDGVPGDDFSSSENTQKTKQETQNTEHKPTNPTVVWVSTVLSNVFLFFLIFGMSATSQFKSLRKQLTNKVAILTGLFMQFVILPFLGCMSCLVFRQFGFTYPMAMSLLVVTCSPGGSYSNWWCSVFNAELALSVAMTICGSLLSVITLPCNLFFYSWIYSATAPKKGQSTDATEDAVVSSLEQDYGAIFLSLGIVLLAIASGLYAGYIFDQKHNERTPQFHIWANRFGSFSGICLILFSFFLSSGVDGSDSKLWNQPWAFYAGVALPCISGLLISNTLTRYCFRRRVSKPESVAVAIECCYQNTGIATSVAITMFRGDKNDRAMAIAVPFFYGVVEAMSIAVFCFWAWKSNWTKAPPDEKLCTVLMKNYETEEYYNDHDENDNDDKDDGVVACSRERTFSGSTVDTAMLDWVVDSSTVSAAAAVPSPPPQSEDPVLTGEDAGSADTGSHRATPSARMASSSSTTPPTSSSIRFGDAPLPADDSTGRNNNASRQPEPQHYPAAVEAEDCCEVVVVVQSENSPSSEEEEKQQQQHGSQEDNKSDDNDDRDCGETNIKEGGDD